MSTVEIPLTQGRISLVSAEDGPRVRVHKWHAVRHRNDMFYAASFIDGKSVYLHRFITGATGRFDFVDHIDRDPLNNTRSNLRICTPAQNSANTKTRDRKLGRIGVWEFRGRWMARIVCEGRSYYLGAFDSEHEAGIAYDAAFFILHGVRFDE